MTKSSTGWLRWGGRWGGRGFLRGVKGDAKPITFVEDTAVPPDRLADFIRRFRGILDQHGVRAAFYAHASVGCLHVRPLINLKDAPQIETMRTIAEGVGELVMALGRAMGGRQRGGL